MMNMSAVVVVGDRTDAKRVKPWHVCGVEDLLGKSFHRILGDNAQNELLRIVWFTHTGGDTDFQLWLKSIDDAELRVGDVADPTSPAPTTG